MKGYNALHTTIFGIVLSLLSDPPSMIARKLAAAEAFASLKLQRADFSANEEPMGPVSMLVVAGIPAYNEERTIAKVVVVSLRQVDKVVVCNDGSTDMTGIIASKLGAEVISHERNLGKGEALRSLFKAARSIGADVLVTLDGDGQHNPEEIPRLVDAIRSGAADVVVGSRFLGPRTAVPRYREVGNKFLNALISDGVGDTQSGFRAYGKAVIESIVPAEMGMGVDSEILMEASQRGFKIAEVPVSVVYGGGKTSKHNPLYHTLDVVFSILKLTSIRHPLMFYGGAGFALVLVGLYFLIRTILLYFSSRALDFLTVTVGFVSFAFVLIGLLTFFTGVILFTITTVIRKVEK